MATTTMTATASERKGKITHIGAPPPEPEHLPCPRCDSTNTKFCYYNNYNFSQPRHFCKSCRRYWTHGGTLRDIPIGGGTRKNAKRSRNINHNHNHNNNTGITVVSSNSNNNNHVSPTVFAHHHGHVAEFRHNGSFTSLLSNAGTGTGTGGGGGHNNNNGNGFLGLGGFGPGIEDLGFGLGRGVWPFHGMVETNGSVVGGGATWQLENAGHHGFVGGNGECFTLPDLAISTPGTTMLK